jgi:hypothetical protein
MQQSPLWRDWDWIQEQVILAVPSRPAALLGIGVLPLLGFESGYHGGPSQTMCRTVMQKMVGSYEPEDDIALVALRRSRAP